MTYFALAIELITETQGIIGDALKIEADAATEALAQILNARNGVGHDE